MGLKNSLTARREPGRKSCFPFHSATRARREAFGNRSGRRGAPSDQRPRLLQPPHLHAKKTPLPSARISGLRKQQHLLPHHGRPAEGTHGGSERSEDLSRFSGSSRRHSSPPRCRQGFGKGDAGGSRAGGSHCPGLQPKTLTRGGGSATEGAAPAPSRQQPQPSPGAGEKLSLPACPERREVPQATGARRRKKPADRSRVFVSEDEEFERTGSQTARCVAPERRRGLFARRTPFPLHSSKTKS